MRTLLRVLSLPCSLSLSWGLSQAAEYELPADGSDMIGEDSRELTRYEDTLVDMAHQHGIGYEEIARANPGVDLWLPGEGKSILLPGRHILPPGPREGIVINLPEHRLYYYPPAVEGSPAVVLTFPVNIGRLDRGSPIGLTSVIRKQKNPSWYPPASIRKEHQERGDPLPAVVPPGPRNPLGKLEMRLAAGSGTYLIHGTNTPWAIGMAITHGCISMYPEDVAVLFQKVPVGTAVWLINAPVKVAHWQGELLIEAHPPMPREGGATEPDGDLLAEDLGHILGNEAGSIEQAQALELLHQASGVPSPVHLTAALPDVDPARNAGEDPVAVPRLESTRRADPSMDTADPLTGTTTLFAEPSEDEEPGAPEP